MTKTPTISLLLDQDSRQVVKTLFYSEFINTHTAHIKQKGTLTKKVRRAEEIVTAKTALFNNFHKILNMCDENQRELLSVLLEVAAVNIVQPKAFRDTGPLKAKKTISGVAALRSEITDRMEMPRAAIVRKMDDNFVLDQTCHAVLALPAMSKDPTAKPIAWVSPEAIESCFRDILIGTAHGKKLLKEEDGSKRKKRAKENA